MSGSENGDDSWKDAEGVPRLSDPFIQRYLEGRDALIIEEKKQRSDRVFKDSLSSLAIEACAIVDQIRFAEQQTLWTSDFENTLADDQGEVYPGMMFSLAKERMEGSKLWRIVKRMPKGALLHCHLEAMVDLDWALEEALSTPGIHLSASGPLSTSELRRRTPFLFTYSNETLSSDTTLWSESYMPDSLMPLSAAAETFPENGKAGFLEWVKSRCTITHEESLRQHLGPNDIWRKFASTFPILGSLIYYEPIFRKFVRRMCQNLLEDGVQWVDMRSAFVTPYRREGQEKPDDDFDGMLTALEEEIQKFRSSDEGKEFWGGRMIWTTVRKLDEQSIIKHMKLCIAHKLRHPSMIAGYDLVGQEDGGASLASLTPALFWFRKACAEANVSIPFFFHAGETLGDGDETDENLVDAILLGTRRIGHGFSLYKHPLLIDMVKEKRILVESCPVSNEVLRLCSSIRTHPLPALLARGVPAALCNDDPTVLGQGAEGMSHDFWQALQGWENLGLAGLGSLAENSVRWAAFEDLSPKDWLQDVRDGTFGKGNRAKRLKEWIRKWERFCYWVVEEFGSDVNLEPEE